MAKAKLGNLVLDVRGKLAGSVWRRSRHGHTVRAAGHQVAAPTAAQVDQRTAFGACKILWSTLTPSELDLWRALAPRPLTGWMFQLKTNLPLARAGDTLTRAPTVPGPTPTPRAQFMTLLAEIQANGAPAIEFADIPDGFTHLQLILTGNTTATAEAAVLASANAVGLNRSVAIQAAGTSLLSFQSTPGALGWLSAAGAATATVTALIPDYLTTANSMVLGYSASSPAAGDPLRLSQRGSRLQYTPPLSSLSLSLSTGNFNGARATLWGVP